MTNRLDELRGLLDAATPGELSYDETPHGEVVICVPLADETVSVLFEADWATPDDAALIVFLRNHAEDLLAVARLAGQLTHDLRHSSKVDLQPLINAVARLSPPSEEGS